MYLKALSIKGFKSFADRTTLEFAPGVAVVVGPNGSGKSNVVDAVAWVLGAQGARSLRGGKMDDVIFAGTPRRAASARAEVSLTIDNTKRCLPVDRDEVSITRTLTRDGESGYALNGEACRLMDIAELLSDTGVGRTQHVIVGQGRLDAILHARPEDRRSVIEEAAGILKYRQRKEKAQRRLDATAVNVDRLGDLLREVRRHLKPLERQADAARRHGGLVAESRALRLHLAGRDLATLGERLDRLGERRRAVGTEEDEARSRAAELGAGVAEAEAALAALPADVLGDAVARGESLLARADGLAALLAEKRRGIDRSLAALADAGVVETLTAEAAALRRALDEVAVEIAALGPGGVAPGRDARRGATEARAELATLGGLAARVAGELERLSRRRELVVARLGRLADERAGDEVGDEAPLVAALGDSRASRQAAESAAEQAAADLETAGAELARLRARAEALTASLDQLRAAVGEAGLEGMEGIAGALVDLVDIEPGLEAAVAAGLGEALQAVVAVSDDAARAAFARLAAEGVAGLVLVAAPVLATPESRHENSDMSEFSCREAEGARLLATCVTPTAEAPAGLAAMLERLLGGIFVVDGDWTAAAALMGDGPAAVAVTLGGDRLSASGAWRSAGRTLGATPGAVEDAHRRAVEAEGARRAALAARDAGRQALAEAHRWEAAGDKALDAHRARVAALRAAAARRAAEGEDAEADLAALDTQAQDLKAEIGAAEGRQQELRAALPGLEAAEADERAGEGAFKERELARARVAERDRGLRRRLEEVEKRLVRHGEARQQAEARRVALERKALAYAAMATFVAGRRAMIAEVHRGIRDRRRERSDAARAAAADLVGRRRQRDAAAASVVEARERRARIDVEEAEVRTRLVSVTEALERDLGSLPAEALAAPEPALPDGVSALARAKALDRDLRRMGPINPLAVEEYAALCERHELLESQLGDVRSARRDLTGVIALVDEEIMARFAAAYSDAEGHFADLIATLFPGGSGRLSLTNPDDLLNTGIEIEARPSGKSVRRLSLLSGGERSLTAMAFLFAVFRARPSPFYILDEVEAALDDINLCRFVDLVHAFRDEAQLLVVSHQKRTMEAADCLYGVSMPPGGSSVVVTQRVPIAAMVG